MMPRPLRSTLFPYTTLFRSRMFVAGPAIFADGEVPRYGQVFPWVVPSQGEASGAPEVIRLVRQELDAGADRKSTRLNSSHTVISYAVFCLKKKITTSYSNIS